MASLFDPTYPSMLQGGSQFDPNKPALLQGRGVEAAQKALEAQRLLDLQRQASAALTDSATKVTPSSAKWTAGQALDGWGAQRGIGSYLGQAAKGIFGPVGTGVQMAVTPSDTVSQEEENAALKNSSLYRSEVDQQKYAEADQFGKDVAARTLNAGLGKTEPVSLLDPNAPPQEQPAQPDPGLYEAPPAEDTPVGPVAQAQPNTVPQAAAKVMQDQETQRQTIEQGANHGLSTGAVSRPEFAQEIVKADAAKAGVTLTPEQFKKATAAELTNMKSMDNKDVSKYISYALMAAGVLAAVFDKSGKAGDAFSASFNRQLDRNLQAGLMSKKAAAEQAKLDQALAIKLQEFKRTDRGLDIKEGSAKSTADYQQGSLAQRTAAAEAANKLGYYREGQANARAGAGLSQKASQFDQLMQLRRDQFATEKEYKDALIQQGNERNVISAQKAGKASAPKGIDITTKDAQGLVDQALSSQDLNVDKPAKSAIAQTVREAAKNNPREFAADPNGFVLNIVRQKKGPYQTTPGGFFSSPSVRQRTLKQQ